ncbi:MAG: hypothetical protein AAF657_14085 [Acidobacteriota bacterium]
MFDQISNRASRFCCSLLTATVCLTTPLAAQPCPPSMPPQVDLGNLEMTFAETGPGEWTGAGLGGAVQVSASGVDVLTNPVDGIAGAVDFSLGFTGSAPQVLPGSAPSGAIGQAGVDAFATASTAYGEVVVDGAFAGSEVIVSGTQRRLELALATTSSAVGEISFTVPGASSLAVEPANGSLHIALPAVSGKRDDDAEGRVLELALVALTTIGEKVERLPASFTVDGGERVGVQLEAATGDDVQLIFTMLYSPYGKPAAVARTPSDTLLALTSVRTTADSLTRQALITELDARGERTLRQTFVDPGGDLEPRGLAVDREGRWLIAGQRDNGHGTSLYLASFDTTRGLLVESPATQGLDGAAHAIDVTEAGEVAVVGLAGNGFAAVGREAADFSLVTPEIDGATLQQIFVAVVDRDLERLQYAVDLEAPVATAALQVWQGCDDDIVVGPGWKPNAQMMVDHTYSISTSSADLSVGPKVDDGWGYTAMWWKRLREPDWTYHIDNVDPLAVPVLIVQPPGTGSGNNFPGDYERLEQLEANQHGNLFFNTETNTWDDPRGGWNGPDNWAYSSTEMAVAAAIYHERWDSPIFVNFRLADGSEPPASRAVMVRSETFSADSASGLPHNACDEDLDGDGHSDFSGDPWPSPPEHQVAAACVDAHGHEFELETVDYDAWLGGAYVPDNTVSQSTSLTWWPWFSPYVGDPPVAGADDTMTPVHVREMSRRLMANARVTVPLRQARYEGSVLQSAETFIGRLCAQDLQVQPPAL